MTHIPIDVDTINWDQFLGNQEGGGGKYFVGQKYMRGYGILGNIGRFLLPIAKNLATTVGSEGVEAGSRILKDVTEGKDFTDSLKEHSKKGLENLAGKMKQCGKGERKAKEVTIGMYPPRPDSPTYSRRTPTYSRRTPFGRRTVNRTPTYSRRTSFGRRTVDRTPNRSPANQTKKQRRRDQLDIF